MGSRTQKSVRNIAFSLGYQLVTLFSNFFMKTVLIKNLGIQYTGVSALFTDILTVLSVAELGFGTAVSYALYRPLYEKDDAQIAKLMRLYQKIYRIIFSVIVAAGIVCLIFLKYIVKDVPDIKENIHIIFIFFILKTAVSYLFVYKATLLEANQEKHIVSAVGIVVCVLTAILEAVTVAVFKSYIGYLAVMVTMVIVQNVIISLVANHRYPMLKTECNESLSLHERKEIFKNVRALAIYKISGALQRGVDSVIISAMLGTSLVGFLSYYKMITNNVDSLFGQVFEAIKPSVGNLAASENSQRQYTVFKKMCFLSFAIGNFISVSLITLLNPFITLWLGNSYLLGMDIVIILVADIYIITMVRPYESFRNANALFVQGKYRPAVMVILNIILSIGLADKWGLFGVLFATVAARVLTHVWYDPLLLYRKVFHKPFLQYIKMKIVYLLTVIFNCVLVYEICNIISFSNQWVEFFLKALLCVFIPNIVLIALFHNNDEFKALYAYAHELLKRICKKRNSKK